MSFTLMAWAVKQRTGSAPRKAVLLALADRTNQDTGLCCPTIKRIAEETELGERTVQRALVDLEDAGFLTRHRERRADGSYGVWHYTVAPDQPPAAAAAGGAGAAAGTTGQSGRSVTKKVSLNQEEPSPAPSAGRQRCDAIWDQLAELYGPATTRPEQSRRGRIVRDLDEAMKHRPLEELAPEIARRAGEYRKAWPTAAFTETALWTRWSVFEPTVTASLEPRERAKAWIDTVGHRFEPGAASVILEDIGLEGDQLAKALEYHERERDRRREAA